MTTLLAFKDINRSPTELSINMSNIGKLVTILTTHREVMGLVDSFKNKTRHDLMGLLRFAFAHIIPFDDDANWELQASPCSAIRSAACISWIEFCNECVIAQTLRLILHNKKLEITIE